MRHPFELARHVDRFMRKIEAGVHARAIEMDVDRIGPFGGMVLLSLEEIEPAPIQQLVSRMARDKAQMTRVVQTLERKGVLKRTASADDGRVSVLSLTPKGRDFLVEVKKILSEVIDEILAPLPAEERKSLSVILRRI